MTVGEVAERMRWERKRVVRWAVKYGIELEKGRRRHDMDRLHRFVTAKLEAGYTLHGIASTLRMNETLLETWFKSRRSRSQLIET